MSNTLNNKSGISFDMDNIATDLNGKMDKDTINASNIGKSNMAGYPMPSSTYVDLTLGANGSTYTAPANGYYYISAYCSVDSSIELQNSSTAIRILYRSGTSGNHIIRGIIPARKGDVVYVNYKDTLSSSVFHFNYAVGSESEAQ